MVAQTGALIRHPGTQLVLLRRPVRPAPSLRWRTITRIAARHQAAIAPLKLVGGALAGAFVTLAIMSYLDAPQDTPAVERVRNETIVYRQDRPGVSQGHTYTEQVEATDDLDDDGVPSNYPRTVQTVHFVNPDAPTTLGTITAAARQSIRQALIKVGGFVAFAPKEDAQDGNLKIAIPHKPGSGIMDEVDAYLWDVYERMPIKKDGTGDFTWKDQAAAKRMGVSLEDYVIGGMDPEFREQLFHAGREMDAAGIQWSMLSAFRDDYRQRLASGFKASVGNSLHGGSRRTGGYGHGRAIDVASADGSMEEVWRWFDAHGAKYGLYRPMPGIDPAHIQQRGDWHKIAMSLRETRIRAAAADNKAKVAKAGL
jgi:hypothetical protein